jgi:hypothetical protein
MARFYHLDLCDFYRGELSARRLAVLIRYLPRESALVAEMNDGDPVWSSNEHLLADLWALLVKAHSDPAKTPDNLDHPARAAMTNKARISDKKKLKERFLARKSAYTEHP